MSDRRKRLLKREIIIGGIIVLVVILFSSSTREIAEKTKTSVYNLRQIGVAIHQYRTTYGKWPADTVDKAGKPLLSWRVALLPFMEEEELYREFKQDEPWDSAHNKPLASRSPKVYWCPGAPEESPGMTYYQGFVGPGTVLEQARLKAPEFYLSKTIFAVEAAEAVPWSKPADLSYDPTKPLPRLGNWSQDPKATFPAQRRGSLTLLMDGHVGFLGENIDPKVLRSLISRDEEPVKSGEAP
jgi:hypothetical protein